MPQFSSSPPTAVDDSSPKHQQSTPDAFIIGASPAQILLTSSIPLLAGTYLGYRRVVRQGDVIVTSKENNSLVDKLIGNNKMYSSTTADASRNSSLPISSAPNQQLLGSTARAAAAKVKPVSIATQALALGSMLSVGGVGLLTAGVFFLSGCSSVRELVDCCKTWTPQMRVKAEGYIGIDSVKNRYANDEDVKAVAGMSEAEEIEFYGRKYIPELYLEDAGEKSASVSPSSSINKR